MAGFASDPWDWEAHEVIHQLYQSNGSWSLSAFTKNPPLSFADALKSEEINGQSLLNDIDQNALREEPFQIGVFGQRSAILRVIEILRNESPKYVAHRSRINQTAERANSNTPTGAASRLVSFGSPSISVSHPQVKQSIQAWNSAVVSDHAAPLPNEFVVPDAQNHKRRRIQPTAVSSTLTQPQIKHPELENTQSCYLGRQAVDLDDMFWPDAKQGDTLDVASDDDDNFELVSVPVPIGQQRFVKTRMQHYLRRKFIDVDSDGKRAIAPAYPKSLVKDGSSQAATIIIRDDSGIIFKRGNTIFLEQDVLDMDQSNTQWDYLLDRANQNDFKEMPSSDDSESLHSYSGSLLAEIEAEKLEIEQAKAKRLSGPDVDALIDIALEAFEERWREEKLPKREMKARTIWRQAQGRKHATLENTNRREVERLETLLAKLRRGIHDEVWTKDSQVTKQCSIMEVTVYNLKDALWKLNLWKEPLCPAKSLLEKPKPTSKPARVQENDADEESLLSDSSRAVSEDDDPDDFMDIDHVSIPFNHIRRASTESCLSDLEPMATIEASQAIKEEPFLSSPIVPRSSYRESPYVISLSPDEEMSPAPRSSRSVYDGFDSLPEEASDEHIRSWTWQTLEERTDRKRIVLKLLHSMDSFNRQTLISHMFYYPQIDNIKESARVGLGLFKSKAYLQPNQARTSRVRVTRLFLCWVAAQSSHWENEIKDPTIVERALGGLETDFDLFHEFIGTLRARFGDAGENELEENEDDDLTALSTPRKPQRKIKESKRGKDLRADAAARREEDELQMQKNILDLEFSQGPSQDLQTAINLGKKDDESFIFLSPLVAKRIKDHQLEGIRFIWREITTEGEAAQGCLLAHTMGLGKTMQTITVLATIAEAAASTDLSKQLPKSLRDPKFLILCPPGLVENWKAEFHQWVQPGSAIGHPLSVNDVPAGHRTSIVQKWYNQKSGVLLLGYDLFRSMVVNKAKKETGRGRFSATDHEILLEMLLKGPSIVVADEAHKMKNHATGISMATKRFETTRRIALTGSPLANNLMEYYAMIDWVAPDFLGDREEFSQRYQLPIERSTFKDSTKSEQRTGLKKLKLLRLAIQDKISRADITVLKDTLPPKTEFVLHVALTPMQSNIYTAVVEATISRERLETTSVFGFIAFLRILCTHPSAFAKKLLSNSERSKVKEIESEEDDSKAVQSQLTDHLGAKTRELLDQPGHDAIELSNKMIIIFKILSLAKAGNESVLLFSQSLDIHDYLELVFLKVGIRYRRLDGSTKMADRQNLAKSFNNGEFDVFLIATRAGGLGLNMPAATRVILVDFSFDPTIEEQAVGRAYRIGQTKPVFVYHLVAGGTFEEPLHQLTIFKKQLASRTVDHKTPGRAGMKMKDYIFLPKEVQPLSASEYDSFRGKDMIMDSLLSDEAIAKVICGITTAETLHVDIDEKLTAEEEGEVNKMFEVENLRKRDPAEYQRLRDANLLPPESSYNRAFELQMRQLAESHARHGGSLAGFAELTSTAASMPFVAPTTQQNEMPLKRPEPSQHPPPPAIGTKLPSQAAPPPPQDQQAHPGAHMNVWRHVLGPIMEQPAAIRLRTEQPNLGQDMLNVARRILVENPSFQSDWESFKILFDAEVTKKQSEQQPYVRRPSPSSVPTRISNIIGKVLSRTISARQLAVQHPKASRDELIAAKTVLLQSIQARTNYGLFEKHWKEECRKMNAQKNSAAPKQPSNASSQAAPGANKPPTPARFAASQHQPWQDSLPLSLSPAELARRAAAMRSAPDAETTSSSLPTEEVMDVDSLMREPMRPGHDGGRPVP